MLMEMWGYILRTAVALLLVIPLIYLAARIYARQGGQGRRGTWVNILEVVPVNQKNQLVVVRIGDQIMVLGVGEHGFQVISTLEGNVPADIPGREMELENELWQGLKTFVQQWRGKKKESPDDVMGSAGTDEVPGETEIRNQIERIRQIQLQQDGESHVKR